MDWSEEYKPSKLCLLFVFRVGGKPRVANRRSVIWNAEGEYFAAPAAPYFAHVGKVGKTPPGFDWM